MKGSEVMLPCLPARSPTWQVCGREESQGGVWISLVLNDDSSDLGCSYLATNEGVNVAERAIAVAISGNREGVKVIDCHIRQLGSSLPYYGDLRNGPPLVGRLEKETWKKTPMPFGFAVAVTEPFTLPQGSVGLKSSVSGRVATYIGPGGLSSVTVALPRMPVTGEVVVWAPAEVRRVATRTGMVVERCILEVVLEDVSVRDQVGSSKMNVTRICLSVSGTHQVVDLVALYLPEVAKELKETEQLRGSESNIGVSIINEGLEGKKSSRVRCNSTSESGYDRKSTYLRQPQREKRDWQSAIYINLT